MSEFQLKQHIAENKIGNKIVPSCMYICAKSVNTIFVIQIKVYNVLLANPDVVENYMKF